MNDDLFLNDAAEFDLNLTSVVFGDHSSTTLEFNSLIDITVTRPPGKC